MYSSRMSGLLYHNSEADSSDIEIVSDSSSVASTVQSRPNSDADSSNIEIVSISSDTASPDHAERSSDVDSSDIEIIPDSIPSLQQSSTGSPLTERSFVLQELCSGGGAITAASVQRALGKYDIDATEEQIHDMLAIIGSEHLLTGDDFVDILYDRCGMRG